MALSRATSTQEELILMPDTNGAGRFPGQTVLGARRRVCAIPKTVTFDVETVADGVVPMVGYCKGKSDGYGSCPVSVTIEAEAAWDVWRDASYPPATEDEISAWSAYVAAGDAWDGGPIPAEVYPDGTVFRFNRAAELNLRRDMLVAVLPATRSGQGGIDPETASVLAADDGGWLEILRDLGWWAPAPEAAAIADPNDEGEAASPSTGEASSPELQPSTVSDPATS